MNTRKIIYKGDISGEFYNDMVADLAKKELEKIAALKRERFFIFKEDEGWLHYILHSYEDYIYDMGYSMDEAEQIVFYGKKRKVSKEDYQRLRAYMEIYNCAAKIVNFLMTNPVCEIVI